MENHYLDEQIDDVKAANLLEKLSKKPDKFKNTSSSSDEFFIQDNMKSIKLQKVF